MLTVGSAERVALQWR